jgi:hypothetical protein
MWVRLLVAEADAEQGVGGDGGCGPDEQAPEGMGAGRASSIRSVISLKVVSMRLRHSAMTFRRMEGMAARCALSGGTRTGCHDFDIASSSKAFAKEFLDR